MPAQRAFLSRPEQDDLIAWMVGHQANYQHYLRWCEKNGVPEENRFTENYLRRWTQRKRGLFQARTRKVAEEMRKQSRMDRGVRLSTLEELIDQLKALAAGEKDAKTLVSLAEEIGKLSDRVARERGEYGKPPEEGPTEAEIANMRLRDAFAAHFAEQKRVIEAKVVN